MATRRKRKAVETIDAPMSMSERVETSLRKIDNGFILEHNHSKPDGSYSHREVYHPTRPKIEVPTPAAPKRAPARFALKKRRRK